MNRREILAMSKAMRAAAPATASPHVQSLQYALQCGYLAVTMRGINPAFDVDRFLVDCALVICTPDDGQRLTVVSGRWRKLDRGRLAF